MKSTMSQEAAHGLFNYLSQAFEYIDWLAAGAHEHEPDALQYQPLLRDIEETGHEGLTLLDKWAGVPEGDGTPHRALRVALVRIHEVYGDKMEDDSKKFPEAVTSFRKTLDKEILLTLARYFAYIHEISRKMQLLTATQQIYVESRSALGALHLYAPEIIAPVDTAAGMPDWYESAAGSAAGACKEYAALAAAIRATRGTVALTEEEDAEVLASISGIKDIDAEDRLTEALDDIAVYGRLMSDVDPEHGDIDTDTVKHIGYKLERLARDGSKCVEIMSQAKA